jgi:hypothetical protein
MAEQPIADDIVRRLAASYRVVTLGGIAVITHGLSRNTHDVDVWLDPMESPDHWCRSVTSALARSPGLTVLDIGSFTPVKDADFPEIIEHDGVIRISGLDRPLDIFRRPNEMEISGFEEVWARATPQDDGTRLPDVVDLLLTKQDTGRAKDTYDIQFLEGKAEEMYLDLLPRARPDKALEMLSRFLNPKVARAAAAHADPRVREAGITFLRELAAEGDPFARDFLEALEKSGTA